MENDPKHLNCQQWVEDFVKECMANSVRPPRPVALVRSLKRNF